MRKTWKNCRTLNKAELRKLIESDLKKDLHMHTVHSDGTLTPEELIDMRAAEGFELLSITDHDVAGGTVAGAAYAKKLGIKFIVGIEFDSEDELGSDLHMLGFGFDPQNEIFIDKLIEVLSERNIRNEKLRAALNKKGYNITPEDVKSINSGRYAGKPTFARILVEKGFAESVNDVFSTIFREPEIRSIKKVTMSSEDAIKTIHAAGGLAVMAHPMEQRRLNESFEDYKPRLYRIMDRMIEYGVDGIEGHHPSASPEQQAMLVDYSKSHGMMITRGSDIHSPTVQRDFTRYHRP